MKPTNPIEINGETYDIYTINLAITSVVNPDASEDANIAMRLIPTRITNGEVILANNYARSMALGRLAWEDYPATGPAEDSTAWVIYKITTDSAGNVLTETSATGAWSNKTQLSYS